METDGGCELEQRRITLFAVFLIAAQTFFVFASLYWLFEYVPAYKLITKEHPIVVSELWTFVVRCSDWLVINTLSDALFPLFLLCFLGGTTAAAVTLFCKCHRVTARILVSTSALFAAAAFVFLTSVTITHVRAVVEQYPSITEYNIWYVNIFL